MTIETNRYDRGLSLLALYHMQGTLVVVSRQPGDGFKAKYKPTQVQDPHWRTESGGVNRPLPQPFLHVRVMCNEMVEGSLAHSCRHGTPPHEILVCVKKKDNLPRVYEALASQAGPKPERERRPRTFYQWLKLKAQCDRSDAVGVLAHRLATASNRPKKNTFEAWKRWLQAAKGTPAYDLLSACWHDYSRKGTA